MHFLFDGNNFCYFQEVTYDFGHEFAIKSKGQAVQRQIWSETSKYKEHITNIVKTIGYRGIGCLNYKVENNTLYVLELNARIGGSMMPRVHELINVFMAFADEANSN